MSKDSEKSVATYVALLKERSSEAKELLIGRMTSELTLRNIGTTNLAMKIRPIDAWFGYSIQTAMRENKQQTQALLRAKFLEWLLDMNCDHPWGEKERAYAQVDRMIDFDPSWTLEDFILFFYKAAEGHFKPHYGRPNRAWVRECQIAYNELKYEAREELARKAKAMAEADAAERAYYVKLGLPTSEERMSKPRTMAEFLSGHDKLSAADRAQMAQRDKERNG